VDNYSSEKVKGHTSSSSIKDRTQLMLIIIDHLRVTSCNTPSYISVWQSACACVHFCV